MGYNFVDDRIAFIEALRERMQQVGSFSKCWDANALRGMNPRSGNTYQGGNRIRIADDIIRNKYEDHRYMTFKQIQDAGYKLKKGAKGIRLEKWGIRENTKEVKDENGNIEMVMNGKKHMFCSAFTVFNGDMIEGLPPRDVHILEKNLYDIVATDIQNSSECPVYNLPHQGKAYYSPSKDEIVLPPRETFKDAESYLSVLIHEIAHSTGHELRLNRSFGNEFGSKEYAKEELRAQMASMFVQSTLGLEINPDHYDNSAAYLKSWDSLFKEEPNEFFKAAADAEKICERVVEKYNEYIKEKELEAENNLESDEVKNIEKNLNGVVKTHRVGGTLASETTYVNGVPNGLYREYSLEGDLLSEGEYKNGKLDGWNYTYYEDGKREKYEEYFVEGIVKERTTFNFDGDINNIVNFNEDHTKTTTYNIEEITSEQLQFERKYGMSTVEVDITKNHEGKLHLNFLGYDEWYDKDFDSFSDLKEELKEFLKEKDFELIKSSLNLEEKSLETEMSNEEFEKIKEENTAAILSGDVKKEIEAIQKEKETPLRPKAEITDPNINAYMEGGLNCTGIFNSQGKKEGVHRIYLRDMEKLVLKQENTYENGNLKDEKTYNKRGELEKHHIRLNEHGGFYKEIWHNNIREYYVETDENNMRNGTATRYYIDGSPACIENYLNNEKHGESKVYFRENGELFYVENYKNGKREGDEITYNRAGEVKSIKSFKENFAHGTHKYFENGILTGEYNYKMGIKEGSFKNYYENGNLKNESMWKNNKLHGLSRELDINGKIISETNFSSGKPVKELLFAALKEVDNSNPFSPKIIKSEENAVGHTTNSSLKLIENAIKKDVYKTDKNYILEISSPKHSTKSDEIYIQIDIGNGKGKFDETKSITENIKEKFQIQLENKIQNVVEVLGNADRGSFQKYMDKLDKFTSSLSKEEKKLEKEPVEKVKVEKETYYTIETEEKILFHGTQKNFIDLVVNVKWDALKDKNNLPYQELEFAAKEGATPLTIEKYGDLEQFYEQAFFRENPNCLPVEINKTKVKEIYKDLVVEFDWSESGKVNDFMEKQGGNILKGKEAYSLIKLMSREDRILNEKRKNPEYTGDLYHKTKFKYIKIKDFVMHDVRVDIGDLEFGGKNTVSNALQHRFENVLNNLEKNYLNETKDPKVLSDYKNHFKEMRNELALGIKAIKKSEKSLEKENDRGR